LHDQQARRHIERRPFEAEAGAHVDRGYDLAAREPTPSTNAGAFGTRVT
jgi:hypothetical protein